jgi:hypothetical protein
MLRPPSLNAAQYSDCPSRERIRIAFDSGAVTLNHASLGFLDEHPQSLEDAGEFRSGSFPGQLGIDGIEGLFDLSDLRVELTRPGDQRIDPGAGASELRDELLTAGARDARE